MKLLQRLLMPRIARHFHRVQVPNSGVPGRVIGVAIKIRDVECGI
jgi:hypothetical protein